MGRLQMNNKPIAWMYNYENFPDSFVVCRARKSDQDIPLYTHPVKKLTDEDRSMLIRTLKWVEDLLRVAGHEEAVSDVQDCLMIIRKAQNG